MDEFQMHSFGANHIFSSGAVLTSGVLGPELKNLSCELGLRVQQVTGVSNSLHHCCSDSPLLFTGAIQPLS